MLRVTTNRGVSKRSSQPKGSEDNMSKTEKKDKPSTAPSVGEGGKDIEHRDAWIYKNPLEKLR